MKNYSTTYVATFIIILSALLRSLGIEIADENLSIAVEVLVTIVSGLWILKERYKRGDLHVTGERL